MLNRIIAPPFNTTEKIDMLHAEQSVLKNGIPFNFINAGSQEVIKLEFIFDAGTWYQNRPLVAVTTNAMLKEGTAKYTSVQIAETLDFFGSFVENETFKHHASVTVYVLNKYLEKVLPVLQSILTEPSFPQKEFEVYIKNQKQKFTINQQKVDVVARNKFPEYLYGSKHPYGANAVEADFDTITTEDLRSFFARQYSIANLQIMASGKVDETIIDLLNKSVGALAMPAREPNQLQFTMTSSTSKKELIEKPDAIQSAIRIGRIMFNKTHPDYLPMQVVNCLLGGYFGSRLMSNIREEKGYTYGIGSALVSMKESGYFFITTEVGVAVCKDALREIYFELGRLRDELVPDEELEIVKNYMLGVFLRSTDGPFSLAEKFMGIHEYNLGYDYYDKYVKTIRGITSAQIKDLAGKYLKQEDLFELVVGKY